MILENLVEKLNIIDSNVDFSIEIKGIAYDSRKVKEDYVFVAIKGLRVDGHLFINKAVENGAAVIISEEELCSSIPYIRVRDSREALAFVSCAFYNYPADRMKIIGVTGTNGKTTSTYLLKQMIERNFNTKVGLIGTISNMIGNRIIHTEFTTPESLELQELLAEMVRENCEYVVMEVSSHSLFMHRVDGITFDVALFTNLTQDHLDLHGNMENYAAAKKLIFKKCNRACVNLDDSYSSFMMEGENIPILTFGIDSVESNLKAEDLNLSISGVQFNLKYEHEIEKMSLAIPGKFSAYNALGVISVALLLGFTLNECSEHIRVSSGVSGRMEQISNIHSYSIIRDYSHTPDSIKNALETLKPLTMGRLIVLFGCGGDRDRLKRPIMGEIASKYADFCIVTSDNPRTEDPMDIINAILPGVTMHNTPYIVIENRIAAIHWAIDNAGSGDVILLAGKGHEDYQIIGNTKYPMDEKVIVQEYLSALSN